MTIAATTHGTIVHRAKKSPGKVFIYSHVATGVNPHDNRDAGVEALTELLEGQGYEVTTSQDPADLESGFGLRPYDAIVFFNTGRDAVTSLGMMALAFTSKAVAVLWVSTTRSAPISTRHGSKVFLARSFMTTVRGRRALSSSRARMTSRWAHLAEGTQFSDEEFYNLNPDPRWLSDVRILLSVDNATREQGLDGYYGNPGMGDTNPVSWCHYYDGGRAWLTTLGHSFEILEDGNWRQHVLGGIDSVMGKEPFCQE